MLAGAVAVACLLALLVLGLWRREFDVLAIAAALAVAVAALLRRAGPGEPERSVAREADRDGGAAALLAALPDPVILVDERLVVTGASRAALAMAPGLRSDHPLSLAIRAPQVLDAVNRTLRTAAPSEVETGGRVPTEPTWQVRVCRLEGGRPGSALVFRDLTEQRRSEAMRVDFVANVSHELRTPLASILGFIETLQGPARNDVPARERFLEIMRGQARRMTRLIDDLLRLSRVEMRAHLAPTEIVDLRAAVRHMVEIMTPLAREREVVLAPNLPAGPVEVPGDRDELLRLVENLVANAVKYGGTGGRVEIALRAPQGDGSVELSVRDHGPGIAPEHLPRLTERFYRVDVAESRAQGGTGLGLAIVKHIVGRHRGRLAIESELGRGATFKVHLPGPRPAAAPPP